MGAGFIIVSGEVVASGAIVAGWARVRVEEDGARAVVYLPVDHAPSEYVAYCLISDLASGRVHAEMGMRRTTRVQ